MSKIVKRSVVIGDQKTSISLEDEFWEELKTTAEIKGMSRGELVAHVALGSGMRGSGGNLSSALRLFVLEDVKKRAGV